MFRKEISVLSFALLLVLASCLNTPVPEDDSNLEILPHLSLDGSYLTISAEAQKLLDEAAGLEEVPAWVDTLWGMSPENLELLLQDVMGGYDSDEILPYASEDNLSNLQSSAADTNERLIEALTAVREEEIQNQSLSSRWRSLTSGERRLCASNPAFCALTAIYTDKAWQYSTATRYEGENGGRRDAHRHSYWTAAMSYGTSRAWAQAFSVAHEDGKRDPLACMDLFNNRVGYDTIASQLRREYPLTIAYSQIDAKVRQHVNDRNSLVIFWPKRSATTGGNVSEFIFTYSSAVKSFRAPSPYHYPGRPDNWCR